MSSKFPYTHDKQIFKIHKNNILKQIQISKNISYIKKPIEMQHCDFIVQKSFGITKIDVQKNSAPEYPLYKEKNDPR